jgi:hypothetical protein
MWCGGWWAGRLPASPSADVSPWPASTTVTWVLCLEPALADELDFESAVRQESAWAPDLLPQSLDTLFSSDNVTVTADVVAELGRASLRISPADVIAANKWRYGRRPVAVLPLVEKVLYRAVVNHIRDDLPIIERGNGKHDEFEASPLESPDTQWVVITDLANFYSSIPTAKLCEELVQRCGRCQAVDWLKNFWLHISDGNVGIPQVSQPSDLVAAAYADELHRRLLRRGLQAWRYVDDFRLAARSRAEAFTALEVFDEEARRLGLFVNERKTYTMSRGRYTELREEDNQHLAGILRLVSEELTQFDPYTSESVNPSQAEVLRGAAVRMLSQWQSAIAATTHTDDTQNPIAVTKGVRTAFGVLKLLADLSALPACSTVMQFEPQLTPNIIAYLKAIAAAGHGTLVWQVARHTVTTVALTRWQKLWLLHLLASDNVASAVSDDQIGEWIRWNTWDSSEYVRTQAIWALARNQRLNGEDWNRVSQTATRLGGPTLAASLHSVSNVTASHHRVLLKSDKLDRLVYNWAPSRGLIPPRW